MLRQLQDMCSSSRSQQLWSSMFCHCQSWSVEQFAAATWTARRFVYSFKNFIEDVSVGVTRIAALCNWSLKALYINTLTYLLTYKIFNCFKAYKSD